MYPQVELFIDGRWRPSLSGETIAVLNPATEERIGSVACAGREDLASAVEAAVHGFDVWRKTSPMDRSRVMRGAAELLRQRIETIARLMTLEQGKPLEEAKTELLASADILDWCAEETRRTYGRIIPARSAGVYNLVVKEPVGPVAAFTPWNFPVSQAARKLAAALAAGCSVVIKPPEETPASPAELIRAFADAGLPDGVINLVYGVPSGISEYLIAHPSIRKVSFTGSTSVGKTLAALAGEHMKRITMELGGHAPAIVFADADVKAAAAILAQGKYRNAGQVCIAPTRFLVHDAVFDEFVGEFIGRTQALKLGDGLDAGVTIGPLANSRRLAALNAMLDDAFECGAEIAVGGRRGRNKGHFFEPTVLMNVPKIARVMNEEPFGPISTISRFRDFADAMTEANRLPYGLASYAYTRSVQNATAVAQAIESGMVSINHYGLGLPELPFGGVKDSGYGSEGGLEAVDAYLVSKFVSQGPL
ncbi:NAD-dependent succinate-semialdehyde dehydrogenase [Bradyrhizobium sp. B097]|uniref:NAD-dependent succinate-semialdehyde dehydrogenase n=1 Tax=Bradyrhizobium sp. B097 TaxID=3140244 RepID=UPI0031834DA2